MKRLNWVVNFFIFLIVNTLITVPAAQAIHKASHPIDPSKARGGVPKNQAELDMCTTDLTLCNAELGSCSNNLTQAQTDLEMLGSELSTCNADLDSCMTGFNQVQDNLAICSDELVACETAPECGNGIIEEGEDCDVDTAINMTCQDLGFVDGILACGIGCTFDDGGCYANRFVENDNGTITDNETGLMWELKDVVDGPVSCTLNLHAVNATCSWEQAAREWINAINAEGGTGFAGYSDWRLPNVKELVSIVDYSTRAPSVDPTFEPTASINYWSSVELSDFPIQAWNVFFFDGQVLPTFKFAPLSVRAVRGGK